MTQTSTPFIRFSLVALVGTIGAFLTSTPVYAHHPLEGMEPEAFNAIQGLISGLAHPVLGLDHLLFLFSIGLVGNLFIKKWIPLLLLSGFLGTLLSLVLPVVFPAVEVLMGLSLLVSVLVSLGLINPEVMIPFIASHGYVLGQSIIGAEPTPMAAYLAGLLISQLIIIIGGVILFKKLAKYKPIFLAIIAGAGIIFTYGTVVSLV
ncbi:HupE/UreJ family protein [Prochlorococcus sp. MIT 1307]|uniref:HupE/UreJ family protein n=1 Tax=Prochlorococcus sp. MIT 1307 TaxID=3096219 RepID=UPI002A752A9B|nr:HupE/UreJ family protein [Prochlorococcus sp. MIT 1307]